MEEFFKKLKETFEKIPIKSKFLKDLDLLKNQTGFRYFMQGHHDEPNKNFMGTLCKELDYDYVMVPIKHSEDHYKIRDQLCSDFQSDLEVYVEKYDVDEPRSGSGSGNTPQISAITEAAIAFEVEQDMLDPSKQLDVSDLF